MEFIASKQNNNILDTQSMNKNALNNKTNINNIFPNDKSEDALNILRHSTAHLLAVAISSLYTNAKFYVGPVIENGFFYDFSTDETITNEDLKKIQNEMLKIAKKNTVIEKYFITKDEANNKFANDELKCEVLANLEILHKNKNEPLSIYKQGDFEDLCAGPHLPNTSFIRFFKLTAISGVHFGKENHDNNKMITRIYGTSFFTKQALKNHLDMLLEAKRRDHRKLGKELGLFEFSDEIGAGLPLWLPNGGKLRAKLERILFDAHRKRGYEPVRAPEILKSDVWKKSGHYQNYKENMYFTNIDDIEYGLKPMNCVGHCEIFKKQQITYKQLPVRFFEYGVVHRHELSGVMHGLFRVREFTQDDAHIYCSNEQIGDEILKILEFIKKIMDTFGFDYEFSVSTKPSKAIGDDSFWELSTNAIKNALQNANYKYDIDEGGGAFYGPKIDVKILDCMGRKWQCSTVQIDMNIPQRLDISYVNNEGNKVRPIMIHRAILGSFERFIGILIEHCGGILPIFIAPCAVIFIPLNEKAQKYVQNIKTTLLNKNIDSEIYGIDKHLNTRIKLAQKQKVSFIAIVGDDEIKNNTLAIRDRANNKQINMNKKEFIEMIENKIQEGNI